ncbi:MAG TPA: glycosyltransferase [Bryobacteraceae bacterium]|nr:glycosyltransferase [Bryobacteraceae bacterium]
MLSHLLLILTVSPFAYYLIVLFSIWRFFGAKRSTGDRSFTPPVSNLQPIRGLDPDAYENWASLCRQDYPDYELLFCVNTMDDPAVPVLEQIMRDFPERRIRLLVGFGDRGGRPPGTNDKVMKLVRLVGEAKNEVLVINDSDVRVEPGYLRTVVAPLADPSIGAVTCFYATVGEKGFVDRLQTVGMMSDFFAGLLIGRQLDGVKFALGPTIATTRTRLADFGGYESLENGPADDLLVGRLIDEHGHRVELLPYAVETVPDYGSFSDLFHKRLRWMVVMRHMRPWGHFGLIFTHGIAWCALAIAAHPTPAVAVAWIATYLVLRAAITSAISHGLKRRSLWARMPLIPLWDLMAFLIWLISFTRSSIRWRGGEYSIRGGRLTPVTD